MYCMLYWLFFFSEASYHISPTISKLLPLWQYGLWSFQMGGTILEICLPKNQHTQRKLLNFKNWVNGEMSKSAKI